MAPEAAQVECYAGYTYPQRPRAFWWQQRRLEVTAVIAEAALPDGKRFVVATAADGTFELEYDLPADRWTIGRR